MYSYGMYSCTPHNGRLLPNCVLCLPFSSLQHIAEAAHADVYPPLTNLDLFLNIPCFLFLHFSGGERPAEAFAHKE